jgi:hypothetical protein
VTPSTGSGPKDRLWEPKLFGRSLTATWRPWANGESGIIGAAYFQHVLSYNVRQRLKKMRIDSNAQFADELNAGFETRVTGEGIRQKLAGDRPLSLKDVSLWSLFLGPKIAPRWRDWVDVIPHEKLIQASPSELPIQSAEDLST